MGPKNKFFKIGITNLGDDNDNDDDDDEDEGAKTIEGWREEEESAVAEQQ